MSKKILLHAWPIYKFGDEFFLPFTNWIYLKEIVKYYDQVVLLSPVSLLNEGNKEGFGSLKVFNNVFIDELPEAKSYISNVKFFLKYKKKYKDLFTKYDFDVVYSRYPAPFGWLQKDFGRRETFRIIHYVGDPLDTIEKNPNLNKLKKKLYRLFFKPEDLMFDKACRNADKVYTNGHHISDKLNSKGINAIPVISSTLNEKDYYFDDSKEYQLDRLKFLYVGYLNKAKGVEVVLEAFRLYQQDFPLSSFTIVGKGELEEDLKKLVQEKSINNVDFKGHIDNRETLLSVLRAHDVFAFGSFSEGSPRVVLEAMANGLTVVSTPVGSLSRVFEHNKNIVFADFSSPIDFCKKFKMLSSSDSLKAISKNAFYKVKKYTIVEFLK
ncbi:MAG TPA: glycosyltransferase family 4 protein, partial [Tissierellaceae bacterium]